MGEQPERRQLDQALEGTARAERIQIGAGLLSLPSKLVDKIRRYEFVDHAELRGSIPRWESSRPGPNSNLNPEGNS